MFQRPRGLARAEGLAQSAHRNRLADEIGQIHGPALPFCGASSAKRGSSTRQRVRAAVQRRGVVESWKCFLLQGVFAAESPSLLLRRAAWDVTRADRKSVGLTSK